MHLLSDIILPIPLVRRVGARNVTLKYYGENWNCRNNVRKQLDESTRKWIERGSVYQQLHAASISPLSLISARFWRILDKALFFEGKRSTSAYKGNTWLLESSAPVAAKKGERIPIPPNHELIDLFLLFRVVKQFENTVVKALRVGRQIRSGKDLGRT